MGSFATVMDLVPQDEDVYVGPPSPEGGPRTYGGLFLAQSLGAAQQTVSDDRTVHSAHSHFLRAGDAAEPTELRVERLRDGRSFSQRQVSAVQRGAEVFRSLVSFHVAEQGLDFQEPISIDVAMPPSDQPGDPAMGRGRPIDSIAIDAPENVDGQPGRKRQTRWMRVHGPLGDHRGLHDAGLAYLSDSGMNAAMLLPHGVDWRDERLSEASLDHTMWFHRPACADEWLYYQQRPESASRGRALAKGSFYDHDGVLVATCMQEGLIRWNP